MVTANYFVVGISSVRDRRRKPIGVAASSSGRAKASRVTLKSDPRHVGGVAEDGGTGKRAREYDLATAAATSHCKLTIRNSVNK